MKDNKKKPKWLKKLRQLLKSTDEKDRDELEAVLEKLRRKTVELQERHAEASDDAEREKIEEKMELVAKHLHKGEQFLADDERDHPRKERRD